MGDFDVDTNGRCFLCIDKVSFQISTAKVQPESGPILKSGGHSLQYLSRYVKLDMSKVFCEGTDVPPDLLAKVAKARLNVELCEDCHSVNESFSKLYRKLEKIELELSSHISHMHQKLAKAVNHLTAECSSSEKFKIAEALREETKQKCLRKLTTTSGPNVRIKKWSMHRVNAERRKIQSTRKQHKFSIQGGNTVVKDEFGDEATETVRFEVEEEYGSQVLEDDDIGSNYFNDNDELEQSPSLDSPMLPTSPNVNMNEKPEATACNYSTKTGSAVPMFEKEDGSIKCKICSKRFTNKASWYRHYKGIHLKIKYKCNLCGIEFNQKEHYTRHHQSIHVGVRFKCLVCNKTFSQKGTLTQHQKKSSCKTGKPLE